MTRLILSLALVLTWSVARVSRAVDLLDNTTAGISTNSIEALSTTAWASFAFAVGGTPYSIDNLQVILGLGGATSTGNLTVQLYAASGGGQPTGTVLASKTVTGLTFNNYFGGLTPGDAATIDTTVGSTGSWQIQASQSYAIVYSTSISAGLVSSSPNTQLSPGTSGLTFLGRTFTSDSGGNWSSLSTNGISWMKVTGTAVVPEPSTWALGAIATGVMAAIARRRNARKVSTV